LQLVLEDSEQSAAEDDAAKVAAEPAERRRHIATANRNRGALPAHLPRWLVFSRCQKDQQTLVLQWRVRLTPTPPNRHPTEWNGYADRNSPAGVLFLEDYYGSHGDVVVAGEVLKLHVRSKPCA
jgi:hypothetical protein